MEYELDAVLSFNQIVSSFNMLGQFMHLKAIIHAVFGALGLMVATTMQRQRQPSPGMHDQNFSFMHIWLRISCLSH